MISALADADYTVTTPGSTNVVAIASTSKAATTYARTNGAHSTFTLGGGPTETAAITGGPTEILTVSNTNTGTEILTATSPLANGSGPIVPLNNFTLVKASNGVGQASGFDTGIVTDYWRGQPVRVDVRTLNALVTAATEPGSNVSVSALLR